MLRAGAERGELRFHLNLKNDSEFPITLASLEVEAVDGQGAALWRHSYAGSILQSMLRPVPWVVMHSRRDLAAAHRSASLLAKPSEQRSIAPGHRVSLVGFAFSLTPAEYPRQLHVRVHYRGGTTGARAAIDVFRQRTRLTLPFSGSWLVVSGHQFFEPHASLHLLSQRFAYDFARVGSEGRTHEGPARSNQSYLAFGQAVLAAADGLVVARHRGIPDNEPVGRRPSWRSYLRQPKDLAGNYVVLKHGAGEYTAYLHLSGEPSVRLGEHVRRGAAVGRCGNSGNSVEPHLHFQLQAGPNPLRARGLPARFSDFAYAYGHQRFRVSGSDARPLPPRLPLFPLGLASSAPSN